MFNRIARRVGYSISAGKGITVANFLVPDGGTTPTNPPYGTILGTGSEPLNLNWTYANNSRNGSFEWGTVDYVVKADGVGGSFIEYGSNTDTATYNQVIDDYEFNPTTRIIYKGIGSYSECTRAGSTGNTGMGTLYVSINGQGYDAGSYSYTEYYDGVCSTYFDQTNYWYSYGTPIFGDSQYNYFWDGNGGYYTENASSYPPYGEYLYSDGGSSDLTWYAPDGNSGTWTYSSGGCSYYADGMGGSYSQCGGWSASYGEQITSGSYSYENGTDEWGNPTYGNSSYAIYYDGNAGYYTQTY